MGRFKIVADSACDLGIALAEKHGISLVPFQVTFDGETYYTENITVTTDVFYQKLRSENVYPKTSLPSIQAYSEVFEPILQEGQDILCLCLTSKFSGSYQSGVNAGEMMKEKYPERNIIVLDSRQATVGQGLLTLEAARMRDNELTLQEAVSSCEKIRDNGQLYITVDSLTYLQKGGRIGKASALAGGLLNIKPIILFSDGELNPLTKVRGHKKALAKIIELLDEAIGKDRERYLISVAHADELEDARQMQKELEDMGYHIDLPQVGMGVTIGAHTGPTAIVLGYIQKYDQIS